MERTIYQQGVKTPGALAVIDGTESLTYYELFAESAHLAQILSHFELSQEEPIGILLGPGIKQVVAQLAVLLAGCTCVPIDPSVPSTRISNMFQDINVKIILLDKENLLCLNGFRHAYVGNIGKQDLSNSKFELGTHRDVDRSHILFTSGSTGKPKPVQISARSIIHLATKTPVTPLLPSDRVAEFNNPGFDLSLFEIWVTLLSGATVVAIPKIIATDPLTLQFFLREHKVTILIMTAALFEIIVSVSPSTFHTLRHVLTAGDVANKRAMQKVLESAPPNHLWNTYGPTECTTLATMFEITIQETSRDRISVGSAVGDMQVFLLDDELKIIREAGKRGEICIAGPQQTIGYLNRSFENGERFFDMSLQTEDDKSNSSAIRLYRTGDIGEWREDCRLMDFIGRIDNQIKHGGFRVELEEIEKSLLKSDQVKLAVAVRCPALHPSGSPSLIAFVVPREDTKFDSGKLIKLTREELPFYMIPDTIAAVSEFPMTHNGKVDRKALLALSVESQQQRKREVHCNEEKTMMDRKSELKSICKDLLNLSQIDDEDDLFALGLSSLQAAKLIASLNQRLGALVTMRCLYDNSRFSCLLQLLGASSEDKSECRVKEMPVNTPDDTASWSRDVDLVDEIDDVVDWQVDEEGRVFITGITGFLGAFFLQHLLNNPKVKQIAVLARSRGALSTTQRIQQNMEQYDLWPPNFELPDKILVIEGDIKDRELGVGKEKYNWLTNWASVVFHLAAKANYCEPYRGHFADNIVGTKNMLRFAATGRRKSFHYMSSIDVWGPAGFFLGTRVLLEDDPLQPHVQGLRYALGYAQSQWTAEGMVRRMRERGFPVNIYRPGFIVGHSETGASNPNDFFSRLIAGCVHHKVFPRLEQRLEYVAVDYVVEVTMHIAAARKNLGKSYSLVSPKVDMSVSMKETFSLLNQAGYKHLTLVDYHHWVKEVTDTCTQQPDGPLVSLRPYLEEKVLGQLTRWEVSQYSPFCDSRNTTGALSDRADIEYNPLNVDMLKRFVMFWNKKGYYTEMKA